MFVLLKKNSNESESRPLDIQNLKDKLMRSLVGRKESELALGVRIPVCIRVRFFGFLDFRVYDSRSHTKILLVRIGFG